jgi:TPR repeat protein
VAKFFELKAALQLVAVVAVSSGLSAASAAPVKQATAASNVAWTLARAQQGDAFSQAMLGFRYLMGVGVTQDYAVAFRWLHKGAEQGEAFAQTMLGDMYYSGQKVVAQDYAAAVSLYRKAAEQGYVGGQFRLGVMYDNGQGVAQDYAAAVSLYRKAADQGDADCCATISLSASASIRMSGDGVCSGDGRA